MDLVAAKWGPLEMVEEVNEGNRNEVWRGSLEGKEVSVRRSRRTPESLEWELDLIAFLEARGFRVPAVIETLDGRPHVDGVVVQQWLDGAPPKSDEDWRLFAHTLRDLHRAALGFRQRPGCMAVFELERTSASVDADVSKLPADVADEVLSVFASVAHMPVSVIHGDPMASNIRIDTSERVGLLDWDESRVDVALHDLSNLGVQVLDDGDHALANRLSDAWETTNGWVVEPQYARRRLQALRTANLP